MTDQDLVQEGIDLCIECAEVCGMNATHCEREGLHACARLCTECADTCNRVVTDGFLNAELIEECALACRACAEECEKHDNDHCSHCAEVCRSCEMACLNS